MVNTDYRQITPETDLESLCEIYTAMSGEVCCFESKDEAMRKIITYGATEESYSPIKTDKRYFGG